MIHEPARQTPVFAEVEVCVLGGGPAGLAAATSAARLGSKVLLLERYGFLGGMGTAGGVTNFAGLYAKTPDGFAQVVRGAADELLNRIDALGGLNAPQDGMQGRIRVRSYDTSAYKIAADQWCAAHGVQLLFHALAVGCVREGDELQALIIETKSGRQAIRARCFIDASGDADLAHYAGVPLEYGDGAGNALYPSTMFRVGHVDAAVALAAVGEFSAINALMAQAADRYAFARNGAILRPQKNPSQWRANVTQLKAADGRAINAVDAAQLSLAETQGREQIAEYMRFLKAEVPGFAQAEIIEIAPQVGVRETRRLQSSFQLSGEHIESSAEFEDCIGINAWPMELHNEGRIDWKFWRDPGRQCNDLPYRMLLPQGLRNLLVAGRCAGMTHEGQSAARASGGCFVMGQAAGTAAAQFGGDFAALDITRIQSQLKADGAVLAT